MATIRTAIQIQDGMTPAFKSMSNALNTVISSFETLQTTTHQAVDTASLQYARRELNRAEIAVNEVEQGIREANAQQQQFNNTIHSGSSAMGGLASKVKGAIGAYLGVKGVSMGMDNTDAYVNQSARLALINDGLQTQEELQQKIFEAAERSRGSYGATVSTVAKLGLLAKNAFSSNDELIAFSELMNKSFKVSGASAEEASSGMYQLTQAMASGRLQGDEFRSIIENAPMLANAIAEYTGVGMEGLKELSSDGAISAEIIKNALFSAGDDINAKFETMPRTFADIWTSIKNNAVQQFSDIMKQVNDFINTPIGLQIAQGISNSIGVLAVVLGVVLGLVMDISTCFVDNWSMIEPIIWGIIAALTVYNATMGVAWLTTLKNFTVTAAKTAVDWAQTAAILALTVAQNGLNVALKMCPITWIIIAVIALIAIFYAAVAAVNHFAGTSASATGMICGAFMVACAFIGNLIIGIANFIIGIGIELYNLIASFANFFANIFNHPVEAIARLFFDLFDTICGIVEGAAGMIDALLGKDVSGLIAGFRDEVKNFVKDTIGDNQIEVMQKLDQEDFKFDRFEYGKAYDGGWKFGNKLENKVSSAFNFSKLNLENKPSETPDYSSMMDGMGQGIADTAGNTADVTDSLGDSEEDLKYLRDIAEQEAINRFTTAEIKVDMGGINNVVNSNMDLDAIPDYLADAIEEQMNIAAEGVHI